MSRSVLLGIAALVLQAAANFATAQPVSYTFSTGANTFSPIAGLLGTSVSGSFTYDASAPQTFTTNTVNFTNASGYGVYLAGGSLTSSYTDLSATVSGGALGGTVFSFSDPRGSTLVSNEGFSSPPGAPLGDFLGMDADPFGPTGTHNITTFDIGGFTLWNMRLFWTESTAGGEVVGDQNLPGALPGTIARLALDFVPTGSTSGTPLTFVFYEGVRVTPVTAPVPEPETYAMLLTGLGLLGFEARRRRKLGKGDL